jgi:hypothetical protein
LRTVPMSVMFCEMVGLTRTLTVSVTIGRPVGTVRLTGPGAAFPAVSEKNMNVPSETRRGPWEQEQKSVRAITETDARHPPRHTLKPRTRADTHTHT